MIRTDGSITFEGTSSTKMCRVECGKPHALYSATKHGEAICWKARQPCFSAANMALPEDGKDRRHYVRVPLNCKVQLRRHGRLAPIRAETRDVSTGGFYCLVNEPL